MSGEKMFYYRISKYDPAFRVDGVYQKDEWTSYSDVGQPYDGEVFTEKDYLRTENQYIQFLEKVLRRTQSDALRIANLEIYQSVNWHSGQMISGERWRTFLQDCLREKCWGRLESAELRFEMGYDFYLHLGCKIPYPLMETIVKQEGLFLEKWSSFGITDDN